jgi:hypothetical protein
MVKQAHGDFIIIVIILPNLAVDGDLGVLEVTPVVEANLEQFTMHHHHGELKLDGEMIQLTQNQLLENQLQEHYIVIKQIKSYENMTFFAYN